MEQNPIKKFRGLEITMDNIRMEDQLLPEGFDASELPYKPLEYFRCSHICWMCVGCWIYLVKKVVVQ